MRWTSDRLLRRPPPLSPATASGQGNESLLLPPPPPFCVWAAAVLARPARGVGGVRCLVPSPKLFGMPDTSARYPTDRIWASVCRRGVKDSIFLFCSTSTFFWFLFFLTFWCSFICSWLDVMKWKGLVLEKTSGC